MATICYGMQTSHLMEKSRIDFCQGYIVTGGNPKRFTLMKFSQSYEILLEIVFTNFLEFVLELKHNSFRTQKFLSNCYKKR